MWTILKTTALLAILVGVFIIGSTQPRSVSYRFNRPNLVGDLAVNPFKRIATSVVRALPFVSTPRLNGEKEGRVNFLLLGVGGEGHDAPFLTDSIAVASLPITPNSPVVFVGIPRDLIIHIPGTSTITKINALYVLGKQHATKDGQQETALIREAVETVTGQPIHYTAVINLAGFSDIVEALDGVHVYVPKDIHDPSYPTPGHGVELFELARGWRFLDGELAEKYIRTRSGIEGDFGRMRRQVQVLEALYARAQGLNIVGDFFRIMNVFEQVQQYIQTDMTLGELQRLWEIAGERNEGGFEYLGLDTRAEDALLTGGKIPLGNTTASALWPKAGMFDYSEIHTRISALIDSNTE